MHVAVWYQHKVLGILVMGKNIQTYFVWLTIISHCFYAVLWPVVNGIFITRSPVEIPFRTQLFVGIKQWTLLFCSMTHYDIIIGNAFARDVHCEIIMGHGIVMGTYHDVTMHTDVAMTLIYYVLLRPIMIFLFSK